jgi:hypothetical protein
MGEVAAGWHPDPGDPTQLRYWDGSQWTEHRHPVQPLQTAHPKPQLGDTNLPTLWQAWGKPLSGIGGGRYRLTAHYLYFERGTLKTDSQQVPVSALHDIDVRQTMSQKARGVGTVIVHINRGSHMEVVPLTDVPNFREGQHAINDAATRARHALQERQNTSTIRYQGVHPANSEALSGPPSANPVQAGPDYIEQLEQLAKLRDNGILSDEEFASKKADILRRM